MAAKFRGWSSCKVNHFLQKCKNSWIGSDPEKECRPEGRLNCKDNVECKDVQEQKNKSKARQEVSQQPRPAVRAYLPWWLTEQVQSQQDQKEGSKAGCSRNQDHPTPQHAHWQGGQRGAQGPLRS